MKSSFVAVVTGDVVGTTKLPASTRYAELHQLLPGALRETLQRQEGARFSVLRCESVQYALPENVRCLDVALELRCRVFLASNERLDIRQSIGLGREDFRAETIGESGGSAYERSGRGLDHMDPRSRLVVHTGIRALDNALVTELSLLEALIAHWRQPQFEVVLGLLLHKSQKDIADDFKITQPAVHKRLKTAGWPAVKRLLDSVAVRISSSVAEFVR